MLFIKNFTLLYVYKIFYFYKSLTSVSTHTQYFTSLSMSMCEYLIYGNTYVQYEVKFVNNFSF